MCLTLILTATTSRVINDIRKKKELIHSVVGSHSFSFGVNRLACSTFDPRIKQEAGK
jgi:hypothetical protein